MKVKIFRAYEPYVLEHDINIFIGDLSVVRILYSSHAAGHISVFTAMVVYV